MIEPLFQATVLAATVTMVTSSYTKMYENQLFETLNRYNIIESNRDLLPETNIQKSLQDHIIIVGYDTQGKRIAEQLKEIDTDFLVIENDPAKISELREKEEPFIYGNVLDDKTWEKSQYQKAGLILSTVPSSIVSNKILKLETDADKILRAKKPIEAERLLHRGALYVIIPEILSAELLKEHILGVSNERNYIEELRRKNLLEIRRYLESEEG
jgi:CPA2 family monovalent cation:H+ antiporter-2